MTLGCQFYFVFSKIKLSEVFSPHANSYLLHVISLVSGLFKIKQVLM